MELEQIYRSDTEFIFNQILMNSCQYRPESDAVFNFNVISVVSIVSVYILKERMQHSEYRCFLEEFIHPSFITAGGSLEPPVTLHMHVSDCGKPEELHILQR